MRVSMIGYGTVGQGVADLLQREGEMLAQRATEPIVLKACGAKATTKTV